MSRTPPYLIAGDIFLVDLLLSDYIPSSILKVVLVIDGDTWGISIVTDGQSVGPVHLDVEVNSYSLEYGDHDFIFYAINDLGFISSGLSLSVSPDLS
jgi:hypothetical protein